MKKTKKLFLLFATAILISCGANPSGEDSKTDNEAVEEVTIEKVTYEVLPHASNVKWSGQLMGVYTHEGNIGFKQGVLEMEGDRIVGGNFTIDMTSITPTDENYDPEQGNSKEKLIAHLESGDFFLVDEHPTAQFDIESHDGNKLHGQLTIRGVTRDAVVEDVKVHHDDRRAEGVLTFNRRDFDVAFTHPIKDMVISNDVKVHVELSF